MRQVGRTFSLCSRGPTPARSRSPVRRRRTSLRRLARAAGAFCVPLAGSAACIVIVSTGPSAFLGPPALVLRPTHLVPVSVLGAACPFVPPFTGSVVVVFAEEGDQDLDLHQVDMRFTDRRGVSGASAVFDAGALRNRFGSVALRDHRDGFAFSLGFGCVSAATGTIVVSVRLRDRGGRIHDASGSVQVDQN